MTDDITAYRDQLAAERGLSDEDRELLLTGADEETLLRQADFLAPPAPVRQNVAPKEGQHLPNPKPEATMRTFAQHLIHGNNDLD